MSALCTPSGGALKIKSSSFSVYHIFDFFVNSGLLPFQRGVVIVNTVVAGAVFENVIKVSLFAVPALEVDFVKNRS